MFYIHCDKNAIIITSAKDDSKICLGTFIHLEKAREYARRFAEKLFIEDSHGKIIEKLSIRA